MTLPSVYAEIMFRIESGGRLTAYALLDQMCTCGLEKRSDGYHLAKDWPEGQIGDDLLARKVLLLVKRLSATSISAYREPDPICRSQAGNLMQAAEIDLPLSVLVTAEHYLEENSPFSHGKQLLETCEDEDLLYVERIIGNLKSSRLQLRAILAMKGGSPMKGGSS